MSAAAAGAAAPPPDVVAAQAHIENSGPLLGLWLPFAVFGHVFAIAFLIHGLFLYMPSLGRRDTRKGRPGCDSWQLGTPSILFNF
ncbi:hypothetical protein GPECTOR_906g162 [Gonium pectorale]|uniref:Uncharacterized protein n=1 Tax=Gonium pectorale TaxID=33097 RepID=A0A150FTU4_GONPE|nr:hypothetical protein GPECTOR_906g162 [Gonium pectorale]|eukprot:KXZ41047.1 hypothetical protein GPECTOR_906g162 [Gonium pectorale]